MKILSWRVDGYGVFAGSQVTEIGPALTIVHGRNESGKTTLVDFLCGVLFGYPDRRRRANLHEPLAGGRHGGFVEVLGDDGTRLRVERYVGSKEPVVTCDGAHRTAADLRRLLGGADESLFRSTFAFGLDELRSLETLEQEEVRELIYSAGVLGAGQRATAALRALDERRARIVRARQADARANHLMQELDAVEDVLREGRRRARHYPEMQADVDCSAAAVAVHVLELEALDRRARELDRLLAAWPVWNRRILASEELSALEQASDAAFDELILALAPQVAVFAADVAGSEAREEQRASLERSHTALADSMNVDLAQLGSGWTVGRARRTDCSIGLLAAVRAHGSATEEGRTAARVQEERVHLARETHAAIAAEANLIEACRPREEIEHDRAQLRTYRTLLAEEARLRADSRAEELAQRLVHSHGAHARRRRRDRRRLVVTACAGLVFLAAVAGAAAVRHELAIAAGACVAIAVAALAIALLSASGSSSASSQRTSSAAGAALEPASDELAALHGRVTTLAGQLELQLPTVSSDLDALEERLAAERDQSSARAGAAIELARASSSLDAELSTMRARAAALAVAESAWSDWKDEHDLADLSTPDEAEESLAVVGSLRSHAEARDRVEAELARHREAKRELQDRGLQLLAEFGLGAPVAPRRDGSRALALPGVVDTLRHLLDSTTARRERARVLAGTLAEADCQLAEMLGRAGCDEGGERCLREAISGGDVASWEEELIALRADRAASAAAHEAAVRKHQDQARQLDAISASDHIARVELERTRLRAELRSELTDWWVLSLARTLVASTLESYERDRQPAVVRRAGELFAEVTSGQYLRVVPRTTAGGTRARSMDAIDASGRSVDIGCLSRGTVEQLYLCLRIALAEVFAEQSVALPFLMDDVLVNLDPGRAQAMASVLARLSTTHQVLFFTCHPHVVEMLARHAAAARLVELTSRSSQGAPVLAPPLRPMPAADRSRPVA